MLRTLRRMIGLFAGYALAVVVASAVCLACLAGFESIGQGILGRGNMGSIFVAGAALTASTAWPGYLVTTGLLLSKRMRNNMGKVALAGGLTAAQALLLVGFFTGSPAQYFSAKPAFMFLCLSAIIGGIVGAIAFSIAAERLFGMRLNGPSPSPSQSKS